MGSSHTIGKETTFLSVEHAVSVLFLGSGFIRQMQIEMASRCLDSVPGLSYQSLLEDMFHQQLVKARLLGMFSLRAILSSVI